MKRSLTPRARAEDNDSPFALPASQLRSKSPFHEQQNGHANGLHDKQRKRGLRSSWSAEKLGLLVLFAGALVLGWFASTWLRMLEFSGVRARALHAGPCPVTEQELCT